MEVDGAALIEGADEQLSTNYGGLRRNLAGSGADDSIEPQQTLAFASVVICVGGRIGVAFEDCVGCEGPNFGVDSAGVLIDSLLEGDRLYVF